MAETASPTAKPEVGQVAEAREVVNNDSSDMTRRWGVVTHLPQNKQDHFGLVGEGMIPFKGHVDDIQVLDQDNLTSSQKRVKGEVDKYTTG